MNHSGLEVEIKLRVESADGARRRLEVLGFQPRTDRLHETNALWDWPEALLRGRGELLRVREVGGQAILTYKGKAIAGKHKARPEIEVGLSSAKAFEEVLRRLGLGSTYRYEKFRTEFERPGDDGHATVDETPIGVFLELEGAPEWIDRVAGALGFGANDYITDSYATLYKLHCERTGCEAGEGMLFRKNA
ncbi:MAG: class IV adenylate cyclase [Bryobacteraceae bacterium]